MDKDFEFIELFEIYKELLTEKQKNIFSAHYLFDLSLSEIAEQDGGTRQSVYDGIKKVKAKLLEYESVLRIREKNQRLFRLAENSNDKDISRSILEIIGR